MSKWWIPIIITQTGTALVEAETPDEAIALVEDMIYEDIYNEEMKSIDVDGEPVEDIKYE